LSFLYLPIRSWAPMAAQCSAWPVRWLPNPISFSRGMRFWSPCLARRAS